MLACIHTDLRLTPPAYRFPAGWSS